MKKSLRRRASPIRPKNQGKLLRDGNDNTSDEQRVLRSGRGQGPLRDLGGDEVTRANAPEFNHLGGEETRLHEGQLSQSVVTLQIKHISYFI